jgi:hypothetical protein
MSSHVEAVHPFTMGLHHINTIDTAITLFTKPSLLYNDLLTVLIFLLENGSEKSSFNNHHIPFAACSIHCPEQPLAHVQP